MNPKNILMIRSHSMGVGDVLRSSAAWASLKKKWPDANLHLLFLSRHQGYPTEKLIQAHHALASAEFVTIKTAQPGDSKARYIKWKDLKKQFKDVANRVRPDLIIDFEPHGLRTTWVTRLIKRISNAQSVGIAQFPGRGFFYDVTAPGVHEYMRANGLIPPMDYTNRDYVALAALGIHRSGQDIELKLTHEGRQYRDQIKNSDQPSARLRIGLNIGCGTADAMPKRPPLDTLAKGFVELSQRHDIELMLTGAPFERDINDEFIEKINAFHPTGQPVMRIQNLAGTKDLLELAGAISVCDVFVSSDSGPYHMAVALKLPTLLWLEVWEPSSIHQGSRLRHLYKPTETAFVQALEELLPFTNPPSLNKEA